MKRNYGVYNHSLRSRNEKLGSQVYSPNKYADRNRGVSYINSRFNRVVDSIINNATVRSQAEKIVKLLQSNNSNQAYLEIERLFDLVDSFDKVKLQWREGGLCDTLYDDIYNYLKVSATRKR